MPPTRSLPRSLPRPLPRGRGFRPAGRLVEAQVAQAGEGRGFAVSRLLTRWTEIVGEETARLTKPVKVTRGRGQLGGTLVLLVPGPAAPLVQMRTEAIKRAVNAACGYAAIGKVRLTQTAATGFAEAPAPLLTPPPPDTPLAAEAARGATDPDLRAALAALGRAVAARNNKDDR